MTWKQRYQQSHRNWQAKEYPNGSKDYGFLPTKIPDITTSNGLTRMILYFLKWEGWRATRVNTQGRLIDKVEKQQSGTELIVKGWLPSTTRRGTADISATIKGRSVMIEVKAGKDKPSDQQLREQEIERNAGGIYEFCYTPDEFLELYNKIINGKI